MPNAPIWARTTGGATPHPDSLATSARPTATSVTTPAASTGTSARRITGDAARSRPATSPRAAATTANAIHRCALWRSPAS
jgi:hypothetical protein